MICTVYIYIYIYRNCEYDILIYAFQATKLKSLMQQSIHDWDRTKNVVVFWVSAASWKNNLGARHFGAVVLTLRWDMFLEGPNHCLDHFLTAIPGRFPICIPSREFRLNDFGGGAKPVWLSGGLSQKSRAAEVARNLRVAMKKVWTNHVNWRQLPIAEGNSECFFMFFFCGEMIAGYISIFCWENIRTYLLIRILSYTRSW
jgi:hypothetical protein